MQMLDVCVLCASCGSSQCCVLHDLQFVNAGQECKKLHTSQYKHKTQDHIPYTNIQHSKAKKHYAQQEAIKNTVHTSNTHYYNVNCPFSNHTFTVDAKSHPSLLCNTHTHNIPLTAPTYTPHCHPGICGHALLANGRRSCLVDHKREDLTTTTSKG